MPKVKINISLSFFVYLVFIFFIGKGATFFTYLIVLFIHEYSHAIVAHRLGYTLTNIKLAPFGICLNINNRLEKLDSIKIAIAGPLVNFMMAFICLALWWIFPEIYFYSYGIFEASLITAIFNLLPCYPLDGSRILGALLGKKVKVKTLFIVTNIVFSVMFVSLFVLTKNFSILLIAIFLLLSLASIDRSPSYDYLLCTSKNFDTPHSVKTYAISDETLLFKLYPLITSGVYTTFVILRQGKVISKMNESQVVTFSQFFAPTTKIKDILKS